MAMQHKHSDTPGARPHLLPGQVGHNTADKTLHIRVAGRPETINLDDAVNGVAPTTGPIGAPLVRRAGALVWDENLLPLSLVDGTIKVDHPPAGFAIPGFLPIGDTEPAAVAAETILLEDFHVASDEIRLTRMGCWLESGAGAIRLGLLDSRDRVILSQLVTTPQNGALVAFNASAPLPRGRYRAFLWCEAARDVRRLRGLRINQGFDTYTAGGAPRYLLSRRATGAFLDGVDLSAALTPIEPEYSLEPGEMKAVMIRWSLD